MFFCKILEMWCFLCVNTLYKIMQQREVCGSKSAEMQLSHVFGRWSWGDVPLTRLPLVFTSLSGLLRRLWIPPKNHPLPSTDFLCFLFPGRCPAGGIPEPRDQAFTYWRDFCEGRKPEEQKEKEELSIKSPHLLLHQFLTTILCVR